MHTADLVLVVLLAVLVFFSFRWLHRHRFSSCQGCASYGSCTQACDRLRKDLKRAEKEIVQKP
jgi:hypothetical protein